MIILHSLKLLEQLSEVENQIKRIEEQLEKNGIDVDTEKLSILIIARQKANLLAGE